MSLLFLSRNDIGRCAKHKVGLYHFDIGFFYGLYLHDYERTLSGLLGENESEENTFNIGSI